MADSTRAQEGRRAKASESEDSVDEDFGGDYSEATLDLLRFLGSKDAKFGEVDKSEKEVEPLTKEDCDELKATLEKYEQYLDAVKQHVPDAAERRWVDYKRALVEGASPEEITWLKLKAYHHGVDTLRAARGEDAAGEPAGVPNPRLILPDLLQLAAEAERAQGDASPAASAAADAVLRAARDALPSSSGEPEPSQEDDEAALIGGPARALRIASSLLATLRGQITGPQQQETSEQEPADEAALAGPATLYRPDFLEEQRLELQLAQQRRQRSQAFTLSLAVALGVSVVRWWLQRRKPRRGGAAEAPKRAALPVPQ